ncbi:putative RNA-directed DNA polymerase from transposon X-element [Araneus ventricosus]|uniref:Putative RNA-directed DNA polymerase from transposon X-element n=1 Tax=Araneus ventricosus TaxID=182803 RepID=A0A4Y2H9X3_ARAVE|nr:putative RNA-directed DNA polymerase from transposon X-element [Araneus ventricosus]
MQTVAQPNSNSPLLLQISQTINSFMDQLNTVLRNSQVFNHTSLQISSWDAGGKLKEFTCFVAEMQPDVIALQETHLNPGDKLKIPNYTAYRTDRTTHRGGGTALLLKNSIDHHPTTIASTSFEDTSANLDLPNNNNISITSIYRPPHGRINTQELDRLFSQSSKAIVVGDYNAKHPAWSVGRSNTNGSIIHDNIGNNNLVLLAPLEPTHFPYHHPSSSNLDFVILKNISSGDATSINDLSSDHNPVSFEININANLASPATNVNITNWSIFCETIYKRIPGNPKMNTIAEVDDCIRQFTCNITTAVNLATKSVLLLVLLDNSPVLLLTKSNSKITLESITNKLFIPHTKGRHANCRKKFTRILLTLTITDGMKRFKVSTLRTILPMK